MAHLVKNYVYTKANDIILVNDKPIVKKELTYFLMNKPTNYLSDPIDKLKRKNIKDLLLEEHKNLGLYPISKIDYSSGGIMVLTNDGILLNKHNQKNLNIEYGYELKISDIFKKEDFKKLRECKEGDRVKFMAVSNSSEELLKFLNSRELILGT